MVQVSESLVSLPAVPLVLPAPSPEQVSCLLASQCTVEPLAFFLSNLYIYICVNILFTIYLERECV